jgi:GT2 family glycosyltransferase
MPKPKALVIIPTYLREPGDVDVTVEAVESSRKTASDSVDILLVDDGSPAPELVDMLQEKVEPKDAELHRKPQNDGFSKTVNVGLQRALDEGRDAVLLNADMEIETPGWLNHFRATSDARGEKAAVVGALLLFPNGLIQHAGVYFSLLTRTFDHRFKFAPGNLPNALHKEVCPVTGAFQFIRHETLQEVGIYDDKFKMGWEDVDYCLRVFLAGKQCVFNPNVRGFHYEQMFRGRPDPKIEEWQAKSFLYLCIKYATTNFAEFVPQI